MGHWVWALNVEHSLSPDLEFEGSGSSQLLIADVVVMLRALQTLH